MNWLERLRRQTSRWYIRWPLQIGIFVGVLWLVSWYQTKEIVDERRAWQSVELKTLDSLEPTSVVEPGHKNLIYVWAPWCGVCSLQTETIQAIKNWVPDSTRFQSIVLSYNDIENVRDSVRDKNIRMPVYLGTRKLASSLNISQYPTILVLDEQGYIEDITTGYTTPPGLWWRLLW